MQRKQQNSRWVSYIYRYRENKKCENAGFVKIQKLMNRTSEEARIQIGMKLYKNMPVVCKVYLIFKEEEEIKAEYITSISFPEKERDTILNQVVVPWKMPTLEENTLEKTLPEYDGLLIVCQDGEMLLAMWVEYELKKEDILLFKKGNFVSANGFISENNKDKEIKTKEEKDAVESLAITVEDKEEHNMLFETQVDVSNQNIDDILSNYPKLPLFPDSYFSKCVKISPQDIGKLPISNWHLGENSFLIHSFYNYRYIILGTMEETAMEKCCYGAYKINENSCQKSKDNDIVVVGVPGVYTNKEKYVAKMFGFQIFVPVKKCELYTGKFGYWINEVSRV